VVLGLGYVAAFAFVTGSSWSRDRQTFADKIVKTVVVRS
jgi:hypothetical protein